MPRPNYGPEAQKRAQQCFTTLLDFACDELEADEKKLDSLRSQIQTHWQNERRLVVRTKVRFLEALTQLTDQPLTIAQIKEALKRLEDFLEILVDNRPHRSGSEVWHFTLNFWHSRSDRTSNLQRFALEWEQRRLSRGSRVAQSRENQSAVEPSEPPPPTPPFIALTGIPEKGTSVGAACPQDVPVPHSSDWLQLCHDSLEAQQYQRLTTNPLMASNDMSFAVDQVYVPLGLKKQQVEVSDSNTDDDFDQNNSLNGEISADEADDELNGQTEETLTVEQFLASLLADVPSDHPRQAASQRTLKRIAIVGEPGAGKTTLLQKTAAWLLEQQVLPIWISLADLQGQTIEQYLLNDWLKAATRRVIVPPALQVELGEQFNQGRVWLLLDAVDEMAIDASLALTQIARQLRSWIGDAHVILTCRVNVWNAGKNALENFEVYQNLSFQSQTSQPQSGSQSGNRAEADQIDQIQQFIQHWFQTNPDLGQRLCTELAQPQRRRIRNAVRNPLRLALLCRLWSLSQGNFPSSRAMLYQQLIEAIYDWKQDFFPTTLSQRQQLNQALGQLALEALQQDEIKFRLPHSFVVQTLGVEALDQLALALQLGWLNRVVETEKSAEKTYAFYHPTFQEYFAAQAISDWRFFVTAEAGEACPAISFRWRQTLLLWLGRADVDAADKEALLQAMTSFEDEFGFYFYQAYWLAAVGLAEFPESGQAEAMMQQLVRWRFGEPEAESTNPHHPHQGWKSYPAVIQDGARVALLQTDRTQAIAAIEAFLTTTANLFARWTAAYSLGKVLDPGNAAATACLTELLGIVRQEMLQIQISELLGKVDPGNLIAIAQLTQLIEQVEQESIRRKAAYSLSKIAPGNTLAITTLTDLIEQSDNKDVVNQAIRNLQQADPQNPLLESIASARSAQTPKRTSRTRKPAAAIDTARAIASLEQRLTAASNSETQRRLAYQLGKFQPGHPQAVATLSTLMTTQHSPHFYKCTAEYLKAVILTEQLPDLVTLLKPYGQLSESLSKTPSQQTVECHKLLWHCAQQLSYSQFYRAWNCDSLS